MFDDWPQECRDIAERLQPLLCRHGADLYVIPSQMVTKREVRVGWHNDSRRRPEHNRLAKLSRRADGTVELRLRVGRDSGLFGPNGPFETEQGDADFGIILLSSSLPPNLHLWIEKAFKHCAEKYGIKLDQSLAAMSAPSLPSPTLPEKEVELALEGRESIRLHRSRERSPKLVALKKKRVLADTGRLECEVCEFDFEAAYGELGANFAECHHREPISAKNGVRHTRLWDLAIVCANCHRMLHRRPWRTVEQLRELVRSHRSKQVLHRIPRSN